MPGTSDAGIIVDPNVSMLLTKNDAFYTRRGLEYQPRDFTAAPAQLYPDDGGTPVSGEVMAPGVVRFDVPAGHLPGEVHRTRSTWSSRGARWTSARGCTGGRDAGACSFRIRSAASLNLSGLAPDPDPDWNNYSDLSFHSLDIEDSGFFTFRRIWRRDSPRS